MFGIESASLQCTVSAVAMNGSVKADAESDSKAETEQPTDLGLK